MVETIHFYVHVGLPESKTGFKRRHKARANPNVIHSESEFRTLMTRNLWEKHMFETFTAGINPWINLQSARRAAESGQSVEVMGCEMDEARIAGQSVEKFTHTKGSIVTPDNLVDFMIERGFKIAERCGIDRELMESYLLSRIELFGQAWTLTNFNISQQQAKVYQRDLDLTS